MLQFQISNTFLSRHLIFHNLLYTFTEPPIPFLEKYFRKMTFLPPCLFTLDPVLPFESENCI